MIAGSGMVALVLLTLAIKINLAAVKFTLIVWQGVRIATTFLLFHLIATNVKGFELIDPKQMQDSIYSIAVAGICIAFVNWKFDLLVSIPIIIFSAALSQ